MPVWIKTLRPLMVHDKAGKLVHYFPGDCLQVGKQEAKRLVAEGGAEPLLSMRMAVSVDMAHCGVVIPGDSVAATQAIKSRFPELPITISASPSLPYPKTLIWDTKVPLRLELMPVGFDRLDRGWQLAAPLVSYDGKMAYNVGTEADRERTKAIVHDLRIPLYETGLMYIRRCSDTRRLLELWAREKDGGEPRLAFLRALFQVCPAVNALPVTWTATGFVP